MMLALLRRSDQPVGVHGGSSEGPVGHEPAAAGHQCHRLGHPQQRHFGVTARQRAKLVDFFGLDCFFALLSFAVLFLQPELSPGVHSAACRGRVRVRPEAKGVFALWVVASVSSDRWRMI